MEILCVFATENEAGVLKDEETMSRNQVFHHRLETLVTGVGSVATAWHLKNILSSGYIPDLVINAGIAGSFRKTLPPGTVVMPVSEIFADLGMEERDGFVHLSSTPFLDADSYPFTGGRIHCINDYTELLAAEIRPVNAVTVNTVTGSEASAERLRRLFDPDIETMEGGAIFYVCAMEKIPFVCLRAVSNYAGPRDHGGWNTGLALENLKMKLMEVLRLMK